ncbi:MAG TPA: hypothetical protein PKY59_12210 [Pyrinomonadaceae bacterium]|nr:hypothetical protein [Pyrinomonadaceae bacterium]
MNYLEEIENEFSKIRGRFSPLMTLDWQLVQSWEDKKVPLSVILRTMGEVSKKYKENNPIEKINSLRYFAAAIEKEFAEWQKTQVGKSEADHQDIVTNNEENNMNWSTTEAFSYQDENIETLEIIVNKLYPSDNLPDNLRDFVKKTKGEIIQLISEVDSQQLSTNQIEDKLKEFKTEFEKTLLNSMNDDERKELCKFIKEKYKIRHTPEVMEKLLTLELRHKYRLPDLTLFAL